MRWRLSCCLLARLDGDRGVARREAQRDLHRPVFGRFRKSPGTEHLCFGSAALLLGMFKSEFLFGYEQACLVAPMVASFAAAILVFVGIRRVVERRSFDREIRGFAGVALDDPPPGRGEAAVVLRGK